MSITTELMMCKGSERELQCDSACTKFGGNISGSYLQSEHAADLKMVYSIHVVGKSQD